MIKQSLTISRIAPKHGILSKLVDVFYSNLSAKGSPEQIITDPITGKRVPARYYFTPGDTGIYRRIEPDLQEVPGFVLPKGVKSIYSLRSSDQWNKEHVHVSFERTIDVESLEALLKTEAPEVSCKKSTGRGIEYYLSGNKEEPILRINGGVSKVAVIYPKYSNLEGTLVIKPDDFAVKILNLIYDRGLFTEQHVVHEKTRRNTSGHMPHHQRLHSEEDRPLRDRVDCLY